MSINRWLGGTGGSTTDVAVTTNWSALALPGAGDDVYVEANPSGTDYSMAASLTTFATTNFKSFNVSQTYTGQIGTASAYLQIACTGPTNFGYQVGGGTSGTGSTRAKIDNGTAVTTFNIYNTASTSADAGKGALQLLGSNAANILNISQGLVSVAITPGETSTLATITSAGSLFLGGGVTLTTVNVNGGLAQIQSATTTLNIYNGTASVYGTIASTTVNIAASGALAWYSSGTVTNMNNSGLVDYSGDARAKTITTPKAYKGSIWNLDNGNKGSITLTNPIASQNCRPGDYRVNIWVGENVQFS